MATSATTSRVAALMGHDELRAPVWLSSARTAPQSEDELVQLELSAAELHRGWLLRCLSFTANRIVAALNEVDLFYATVPQQRVTQRQLAKRQPVRTHMGHALWAWSKAPAREPVGPPLESIITRPPPAPLRIELQALPVKTRYSCSSACSGCARAPVPCTSGCSG